MAKEFTLKGIVKFLGGKQAEADLKRVDAAALRLQNSTRKLSSGARDLGAGLTVVAGAGLIVDAGFGKAIMTAASFEQQMARNMALTTGTAAEMKAMGEEAKRLGATTEFTATQAAQGLEFLALAGFNAKDSTGLLTTVLDTAAAGAMDLARASDIVTDSMSALTTAFDVNMAKTERATKLADVMALAQSRSNTNIEQLGEAIKFGGGTLASLGIPLEQIIASMGKLADVGLKGSLGGTALTNMFNKLLKPSKNAAKYMQMLGVTIDDLPLQDVPKTIDIIGKALDKVKDPNQRAALAMELFGQRGIRAYNGLRAAGGNAIRALTTELEGAKGSAKRIADAQRATFMGQVKAFKSAVEGIAIEIGNFFIKNEKTVLPIFRNFVKSLQQLGLAFQIANKDAKDQHLNVLGQDLRDLTLFAMGFKEGINDAFTTAQTVIESFRQELGKLLPLQKMNAQDIGRMVAKYAVLLGMVSPLILGFLGFAFSIAIVAKGIFGFVSIFSGMIGLIRTGISVISILSNLIMTGLIRLLPVLGTLLGLLAKSLIFLVTNPIGWVILGIVALVAIGWWLYKNWDTVTELALGAWLMLSEGVKSAWASTTAWIKEKWSVAKAFLSQAFQATKTDLLAAWGMLTMAVEGLWEAVTAALTGDFDGVIAGMKKAWTGLKNFFLNSGIGTAITKVLLFPFRAALTPFAELAKLAADSSVAQSVLSDEKLNFLKSMAEKISLFDSPQNQPQVKLQRPGQNQPNMPDPASRIDAGRSEQSRLSLPSSAKQTVDVSVNQPPIEATITNVMTLDGQVISKAVSKKALGNSERMGTNIDPKARQRYRNGVYAGASI